MPQAGYPPYPSGGAPYPPGKLFHFTFDWTENQPTFPFPGPHENMNPPSYDQVVGTAAITTTNENYAKQAPYNPSFTG